jgi:hypothetical protein
MAHFLRVGNRAHVRGNGRALISPLVACGAHEPAATVDGATRREHVLASDPHLTTHLDDAIAQARAELGPSYDSAASRGGKLTDDELIHYLQRVVADLETKMAIRRLKPQDVPKRVRRELDATASPSLDAGRSSDHRRGP